MTCWVLQLLSDSIDQLHLKTAPRPVGCGSKDWPGGNQAFSAGILGYLLTFINVYMCILYMCISVCVYIYRERELFMHILCHTYISHVLHAKSLIHLFKGALDLHRSLEKLRERPLSRTGCRLSGVTCDTAGRDWAMETARCRALQACCLEEWRTAQKPPEVAVSSGKCWEMPCFCLAKHQKQTKVLFLNPKSCVYWHFLKQSLVFGMD